jgi:hypothetical protein
LKPGASKLWVNCIHIRKICAPAVGSASSFSSLLLPLPLLLLLPEDLLDFFDDFLLLFLLDFLPSLLSFFFFFFFAQETQTGSTHIKI